jgi:hypothetical protein
LIDEASESMGLFSFFFCFHLDILAVFMGH